MLAAGGWRRVPHVLCGVLRCQPELLEVYAAAAAASGRAARWCGHHFGLCHVGGTG